MVDILATPVYPPAPGGLRSKGRLQVVDISRSRIPDPLRDLPGRTSSPAKLGVGPSFYFANLARGLARPRSSRSGSGGPDHAQPKENILDLAESMVKRNTREFIDWESFAEQFIWSWNGIWERPEPALQGHRAQTNPKASSY